MRFWRDYLYLRADTERRSRVSGGWKSVYVLTLNVPPLCRPVILNMFRITTLVDLAASLVCKLVRHFNWNVARLAVVSDTTSST